MVFAHLVHTQLEPLLEFLCSLPGPTGKPALEFVMAEWTSRQHLFYGQYEGKVRWASPGAPPGLLGCSTRLSLTFPQWAGPPLHGPPQPEASSVASLPRPPLPGSVPGSMPSTPPSGPGGSPT